MIENLKNYTYAVLRFIPDVRTGEFLNVGVALHSQHGNYANALCRSTVGRITKLNHEVDGYAVLRLVKAVKLNFDSLTEEIGSQLSFKPIESVEQLCIAAMPKDDSSLQWSNIGSGRCKDFEEELHRLYSILVTYADEEHVRNRRVEEDIWRSFSKTLETRDLQGVLEEKVIYAESDEVKFEHAYKNGKWHCFQPVSFDLVQASNIKEKAHKWLGQLASVQSSKDSFKTYFLLAEPRDSRLTESYENAKKILAKSPIETLIFEEKESSKLVEKLESIVRAGHH